LIEMAKVAADDGFDWIDLGRGDQRYKMELKSGDYGLQEGILSRPQWRGDLVMRKRVKWAAFRQSRLGEFLKSKKKMLFGK
jgi:CelD/BcsL family acetyltransferase involved in cellulose biosynthesis